MCVKLTHTCEDLKAKVILISIQLNRQVLDIPLLDHEPEGVGRVLSLLLFLSAVGRGSLVLPPAFILGPGGLVHFLAAALVVTEYLHLVVLLDDVDYEVVAARHVLLVILLVYSGNQEVHIAATKLVSLVIIIREFRAAFVFTRVIVDLFFKIRRADGILILQSLELRARLDRHKPGWLEVPHCKEFLR